MPDLAVVIVPHPIGGIDPQKVASKADDAFQDMIEVLTMPEKELSERARKQS